MRGRDWLLAALLLAAFALLGGSILVQDLLLDALMAFTAAILSGSAVRIAWKERSREEVNS